MINEETEDARVDSHFPCVVLWLLTNRLLTEYARTESRLAALPFRGKEASIWGASSQIQKDERRPIPPQPLSLLKLCSRDERGKHSGL
jgi:hypothetical protein